MSKSKIYKELKNIMPSEPDAACVEEALNNAVDIFGSNPSVTLTIPSKATPAIMPEMSIQGNGAEVSTTPLGVEYKYPNMKSGILTESDDKMNYFNSCFKKMFNLGR